MTNEDNLVIEIAKGERLVAKTVGNTDFPAIGIYFETMDGNSTLICFAGRNPGFLDYPDIYVGVLDDDNEGEACYASTFLDSKKLYEVAPSKQVIYVDFKNRTIVSGNDEFEKT